MDRHRARSGPDRRAAARRDHVWVLERRAGSALQLRRGLRLRAVRRTAGAGLVGVGAGLRRARRPGSAERHPRSGDRGVRAGLRGALPRPQRDEHRVAVSDLCGRSVDDDGVKGGSCSGGPSGGSACDAQGITRFFGKTSLDCLPSAGSAIGDLVFDAKQATTGTKTISTSAESPNCRGGAPGEKCFCDTCDDRAATPCQQQRRLPRGRGNALRREALSRRRERRRALRSGLRVRRCIVRPAREPPKRNACIGGTCTPNPGTEPTPTTAYAQTVRSIRYAVGSPFAAVRATRPATRRRSAIARIVSRTKRATRTCAECFLDPVVTRTGTPRHSERRLRRGLLPRADVVVGREFGGWAPGLGTFLIPYTLGLAVP